MKTLCNSFLGKALLLVLLGSLQAYGANLWISEVLFEPPTDPQTTNEYVELRGTPNYLIPTNTYFVAIDGDADDIGKIRNVFPIGGKRIGNNGFLVLLQKASLFSPDTNAIRLQNTGSEFGWGDDSTSSIGHNGTSGETNIRDATVTFLLLESPIFPDPGTIVDQNNDGTLDGTATNWTVLDSIGVLDSSGADRSYGAITVRNSANTTNFPAGNVVRVAWTAKYVGRNGHTTGSVSNDWVASATLQNNAPSYKTHASQATSGKANTSLNHLGGPNFGAAVLDAVRLTESSGSTEVSEGSTTADSYHLRLNTSPGSGKTVTIEIQADAQIRISTSAGGPFTNKTSVTFNASTWNDVETIYVRSIDDSDVEASPHSGVISHAVTNSTASDYPLTTVIPEVFVQVTDNEGAIFGDVSVNPPGNPDAPGEWIEILAQPNVYLKDLYVLALDGSGSGIGKAYTAIAITNILLGSNGVLFVGATNHPYAIPAGTVEVRDAQFNTTNSAGAFDNNTLSVLLVRSATPILPETDLDPGNTGTLSLPAGAQVMDALGWKMHATNVVYGGVILTTNSNPPDAASRLPANTNGIQAAAWFFGELSSAIEYDVTRVSTNAPVGPILTVGTTNNMPPNLPLPTAWSGVIGDPTNPKIKFIIQDDDTAAAGIVPTVASGNTAQLPNAQISLTGGSGVWTLAINPTNVCYDVILTVTASDGRASNIKQVRYSASAGWRTNSFFPMSFGDASAAIPLGQDLMLVADDEEIPLHLISRTNSGLPIKSFDFSALLQVTQLDDDGTLKETDWEGAARTGDTIYWLGGLSNGGDGRYQTNRNRLLATRVSGSGTNTELSYVGHYQRLRDDLINWDRNGLHGRGQNYYALAGSTANGRIPKSSDGFAAEALTMTLDGNTNSALIGFRAPLVPVVSRRAALLVPVTNLSEIVVSNFSGWAQFGEPVELDLGGRGIRSMEKGTNGYLIVAGPPESNSGGLHEFRLFSWSGDSLDAPKELAADLSGLNPEAIVEIPGGNIDETNQVQLLSDSGTVKWYSPFSQLEDKDLPEANFRKFRSDWVALSNRVQNGRTWIADSSARLGTFIRGTGTNSAAYSSVASLNGLKGVEFALSHGETAARYPGHDWTNVLLHYNATDTNASIPFMNPIVAYGSDGGGSPLYVNRAYGWRVTFGSLPHTSLEAADAGVYVTVYDRATMSRLDTFLIPFTLDPWSQSVDFHRDGIVTESPKWGLTTTIRPSYAGATHDIDGFLISQKGTKTGLTFVISGLGFLNSISNVTYRPTLVTNLQTSSASPLYALSFDEVPAWRSLFIERPHFTGQPVPPSYGGAGIQELLQYSQHVTGTVNVPLPPASYTNLNHSPELRAHPELDLLVSDYRHDPIKLANFVFNEIALTDTLRYHSYEAVHLGGVSRGAYATLKEGQGSAAEQCALLIYLLRKAGTPAVYMFPTNGGLKILNSRLAGLLGFSINAGDAEELISVNYPWVAAYIGTNWVHVFPWLKDGAVEEGLNLYDYMPKHFNSGYKWARALLNMELDILNAAPFNAGPDRLFPSHIQRLLNENHPGIGLDDLGRKTFSRKHHYTRWEQFPQPTQTSNSLFVVESLGAITSTFPAATNLFDTLTLQFTSADNPTNAKSTGPIRLLDLHNRRFVLWYRPQSPVHEAILTLNHFHPGFSNRLAFSRADALSVTNTAVLQVLSMTNILTTNENRVTLKTSLARTPQVNLYGPPSGGGGLPMVVSEQPFQGVQESVEEREVLKGDLVALGLNVGRISEAMFQEQLECYQTMSVEIGRGLTTAAALTPEKYEGQMLHLVNAHYGNTTDDFTAECARLHKARIFSTLSLSLARLKAKRTSDGTLPGGAIQLQNPGLDVFLREITYTSDGHRGTDSDTYGSAPSDSFFSVLMLNNAAQESTTLNAVFGRTNAVSTYNLLQRATLKTTPGYEFGVLELHKTNYMRYAEMYFGSGQRKKLKDWEPAMWRTITNALNMSGLSNDTRILITKGPITNHGGAYLAAMVFANNHYAALLGQNWNGAELPYGALDNSAAQGWGAIDPGEAAALASALGPDAIEGSGSDGVALYMGNDGQFHPEDWFGDHLFAGDRVVDAGKADDAGVPAVIYVSLRDRWIFDSIPLDIIDLFIPLALLNYYADEALSAWTFQQYNTRHVTTPEYVGLYYDPGSLFFDQELIADNLANYGFTGEPEWRIDAQTAADPVDVTTGVFVLTETDITIRGSFPLSLRRSYSSSKLAESEVGYGWTLNFYPQLVVTVDEDTSYIRAVEENGSVLTYRKVGGTNLWQPRVNENKQLANLNQAGTPTSQNMFKSLIYREGSGTNAVYFWQQPDGAVRRYSLRPFEKGRLHRRRPYLDSWKDAQGNGYSFEYGQNESQNDYGKIRRIQANTGAFLLLHYNAHGRLIRADSGDGQSVNYSYSSSFADLSTVSRNDGMIMKYEYEQIPVSATSTSTLYVTTRHIGPTGLEDYVAVPTPVVYTNKSSSHRISRIEKPDGRILANYYDSLGRVTQQWATAGADLRPVITGKFAYTNNYSARGDAPNGTTWVTDGLGNTTRYEYTNGLFTLVEDPLGRSTRQSWYWSTASDGSYVRSLKSRTDPRGLTTTYYYDSRGNIASNVVSGADLTGDGQTNAAYVYSYDSSDRLTGTVDPLGKQVQIFYDEAFTRLPKFIVTKASNGVVLATNAFYYSNATNSHPRFTNYCLGVLGRTITAFGSAEAATNEFVYDGRGLLQERTSYSGTNTPHRVVRFVHDDRGFPVEVLNPDESRVFSDFDMSGNLTLRRVFERSGRLLSREAFYFNDNHERTWADGPRYGPEDYVWVDYDGMGRPTDEIRWRSRAKVDGSGVEQESDEQLHASSIRRYDIFGNLTRHIHPNGTYQLMKYDKAGQMTERWMMTNGIGTPLALEKFAYEPGGQVSVFTNAIGGVTRKIFTTTGQVKQQHNPDGAVLQWVYDLNGRIRREFLANSNYWETVYDDVGRVTKRFFNTEPSLIDSAAYDRRGNVTITTNRSGAVSWFAYDNLKRPTMNSGPPTHGGSVQQIQFWAYSEDGLSITNKNILGESVISVTDALGRVITNDVVDASGTLIRRTTTAHAPDNNSVTTVLGTGSSAISNTVYFNVSGQPVINKSYPSPGTAQFSLNVYDLMGNLVRSVDEMGATQHYSYDALNRLTAHTLPDGAVSQQFYDAAGNLTSLIMPGGMQWTNTYDAAGRKLGEELRSGGDVSRQYSWQFFTNGPRVGQLKTSLDLGRGITKIYGYDDFLRLTNETALGTLPELSLTNSLIFDAQGRISRLAQHAGASAGTEVVRAYDGYGQLTNEAVSIAGLPFSGFSQHWDAAGRRSLLAATDANYSVASSYRADGLLAEQQAAGASFEFDYENNGLIASRTSPWRTWQLDGRDGMGRPWQTFTWVDGNFALWEYMEWRDNSTLSTYYADRNYSYDWRTYAYNVRGQLTNETLDGGNSINSAYSFDANKLGVRTAATHIGDLTNRWFIPGNAPDAFGRVAKETSVIGSQFTRASGTAPGAAQVKGTLNGSPLSNLSFNSSDAEGKWFADLVLSPGTHTLNVKAVHPLGQFTNSASSTFTVLGQNEVTNVYDAAGFIVARLHAGGRTQTLHWDAAGRLTGVTQRDSQTNGYNWTALYDALGRRLRTTFTEVTVGTVSTNVVVTDSFYDPQVEFLEVGVSLNGERSWKVLGPDITGSYGSANGIGGLEAVIRESDGRISAALSDHFGNVLATVSSGAIEWTRVWLNGYGPVVGDSAPVLSASCDVAAASVWRSRRMDPTGFWWMGARYYDARSGRFLSPDPLSHLASWDLYSYAGGDSVNKIDPDGRLQKGFTPIQFSQPAVPLVAAPSQADVVMWSFLASQPSASELMQADHMNRTFTAPLLDLVSGGFAEQASIAIDGHSLMGDFVTMDPREINLNRVLAVGSLVPFERLANVGTGLAGRFAGMEARFGVNAVENLSSKTPLLLPEPISFNPHLPSGTMTSFEVGESGLFLPSGRAHGANPAGSFLSANPILSQAYVRGPLATLPQWNAATHVSDAFVPQGVRLQISIANPHPSLPGSGWGIQYQILNEADRARVIYSNTRPLQ